MSAESPATKRLLTAGVLLLLGLGVAGAWLSRHGTPDPSPPPTAPDGPDDPRRTYTGPYRNIAPEVRYVGDARCADCHADIARTYARHPMGQSLQAVAELLDRQRYSPESNNPFTTLGRRFLVDRQGDRVWHRQAVPDAPGRPVVESAQEVGWAIGSGKKGYSYMTERDGYLLQTPISWFTQKQRWDLSPGFVPSVLAGRVVSAACLSCHVNRVREHPEHADRFQTPVFEGHAIGCERCHGPGELHARGEGEHTIVNPALLPPPLRDAVCEQCHLEGEGRVLRSGRRPFDYRPGLPLSDFWAVLVQGRPSGEDARAVNHVEQMYQSRCFQRSTGGAAMGCITCHDPHLAVGPAERVEHYRAACLKCHGAANGPGDCSVPLARRRKTSPHDSCIDCHMTRYVASDIAHTASTDHRILLRPAGERPGAMPDFDSAPLADFYRERYPQGDPQTERNLGLGLVKMMNGGLLRPERHGERALRLLESALAQYPQDADVRTGKAQVLLLMRRPGEALSEARLALAMRPGDWRLLAEAAGAAQLEQQTELAIDYWRRSVEINPFVADHLVSLIGLLIRAGQTDEARVRCRQLVQFDPFNVAGRQLWIGFLLQDGQRAQARDEFDIIRRLNPPDLARREEWFRQQLFSRDP
jgi:predicted CXXCH cytochrome family protein